jgi:hypothetical protein
MGRRERSGKRGTGIDALTYVTSLLLLTFGEGGDVSK